MRQSVRALGWTITIATLLTVLFLGTAVYSMVQTILTQGFSFEGFQPYLHGDGVILSFVLSINNSGYYDMSDFNLTTCVRESTGGEIAKNSTIVAVVKAGDTIATLTHNTSISVEQLLPMLFADGNFTVDTYLAMTYAYGFSFQLEIPNTSLAWGAPFSNLSIGEFSLSQNVTHYLLSIPLNFENHATFDVTGVFRLEVHNSTGNYLSSGTATVDVLPGSPYSSLVTVSIPVETPLTENGSIHLYFENPTFSVGPVEKPYG